MTTEVFKRRLTVIFSADVEGYSRLMREDEEATVRTITSTSPSPYEHGFRRRMTNLL
jgi:hypothetical protein